MNSIHINIIRFGSLCLETVDQTIENFPLALQVALVTHYRALHPSKNLTTFLTFSLSPE